MPHRRTNRFPGQGQQAASRCFGSVAERLFFEHELARDEHAFLTMPPAHIECELDKRWAKLNSWEANAYKEMAKELCSDVPILKHTPMSRCVQDVINEHPGHFCNGIGWQNVPRQTRTSVHQPVTRKSAESVTAISADAERVLIDFMSDGNFATNHRKRKTLSVQDLDLVRKIKKMG